MTEEAAAGTYVCECCDLPYSIKRPISNDVEARLHRVNTIPTRCARCAPHRAAADDLDAWKRLHDDHTRWYWEQYQKGLVVLRKMQAQVEHAEVRVSDFREKTRSAYRSRDHAVRLLRKIADLHQPERRGCSCGKRPDCETAKIIDHGWVVERIRDLELREAAEDLYPDLDDQWDAG